MHKEDKEILLLLRKEETRREGFDRLVKQYQQEVYWLIRRMVIDHDDASDLAQDTFIKVWKNIGDFRGDSTLFTWIFRIATNESLSFLKKKRISSIITLNSVENLLSASMQNDAFYRADLTVDRFQKALLRLPDKQRLVFNLKYFDEVTFEEMAQITGTSVGALKASYHHAVKKIEKIITSG